MRKKVLTMSVVLILVLLIVLAVVVAALGSVRFQQGRARHSENPDEFPGVVRFVVPDGQDPEAVVAGLELTDLEVSLHASEATSQVLIGPPPGGDSVDREHVRAVLAGMRRTTLDIRPEATLPPVRFADEPAGREGRS